MSANVTITKRLYDFWLAEANAVHAHCDRLLVPRTALGQELTLAQRVEVLAGVCEGLRMRVIQTVGGVQ